MRVLEKPSSRNFFIDRQTLAAVRSALKPYIDLQGYEMRIGTAATTYLALTLSISTLSPAQSSTLGSARPEQDPLDVRVKSELASFKGRVNLFAKNLDTGAMYALGADERVRTASTIKIAVMVEAFARVAEGKAKWTGELLLTKEKKVSGSGVLQELSEGLQLSLRDGVNLMMLVSDNTATNLVLDVLTTDAVNARMESLGFKNIKILRKVGSGGESVAGKDPENKRFGLGFSTPREMVLLMEELERGKVVSPAASKEMIDLMKREQARYAIGRTLWELPLASKYGALDRLRSAVGIVYTKKGRIAMAITCDDMPAVDWSVDNPGYLLMSRVSEILIDALSKD